MSDKNSIWNAAAVSGLVLGGISILYTLCTALLGKVTGDGRFAAVLTSLASTLLWIAKFGGCIWLMRYFMLKFSARDPEADNRRVFRFGMLTALLSALVFSAFYMAYMLFIEPDSFNEAFDMLRNSPMMDSNTLETMEQMLPMMPTYTFFGNLIYCFLFGTVLSAIFSRNIPPRNPFSENGRDSMQ